MDSVLQISELIQWLIDIHNFERDLCQLLSKSSKLISYIIFTYKFVEIALSTISINPFPPRGSPLMSKIICRC